VTVCVITIVTVTISLTYTTPGASPWGASGGRDPLGWMVPLQMKAPVRTQKCLVGH